LEDNEVRKEKGFQGEPEIAMLTAKQIAEEFNLNSPTPSWFGNGGLTEADMKGFLDKNISPANRPTSVLYNCLPAYIQAERENGVNGVYLFCHSILESGYGQSAIARRKNNIFGFQAYDKSPMASAKHFESPGDSILAVSKYIKKNYLLSDGKYYSVKYGPTLKGMGQKYATDPKWSISIATLMLRFAEFVNKP
jgi:beta-N-acetylglucosaminidase